MFQLKYATSEVARWAANNLSDEKKEKLVALSRERLRRRYVGRDDLQEAATKWSNVDVVAALVTHVSDSCTMELLLDLYCAFCTFEEGIFKQLAGTKAKYSMEEIYFMWKAGTIAEDQAKKMLREL